MKSLWESIVELVHFLFLACLSYGWLFSTIWIFVTLHDIDFNNDRFVTASDILDIFGWIAICIFFLLLEVGLAMIVGFVFAHPEKIKELLIKYW